MATLRTVSGDSYGHFYTNDRGGNVLHCFREEDEPVDSPYEKETNLQSSKNSDIKLNILGNFHIPNGEDEEEDIGDGAISNRSNAGVRGKEEEEEATLKEDGERLREEEKLKEDEASQNSRYSHSNVKLLE